jgi:rod shape-determining protein MreD
MLRPRLIRGPGRLRSRINRVPSPVLAIGVPWLSVMLASLVPGWLVIGSAPVLPPVGFLVLVAWRQLRPGLLPIWCGLPLGLFDDLYSGQPIGSAILLWSAAMILIDIIEARFPWRTFLLEWAAAAAIIAATVALAAVLANAAGGMTPLLAVVPQAGIAVLVYPLVARAVAGLDRLRLVPFVDMD